MGKPWYKRAKQAKQLTINGDPSLEKTAGWKGLLAATIPLVNKLFKDNGIDLTFVASNVAYNKPTGADVGVRLADGEYEFEWDGQVYKPKLDGRQLHGRAWPMMTSKNVIHNVLIVLPRHPEVRDGGKPRTAGPGILQFILGHEMIHAVGLVDDGEHSTWDLFAKSLQAKVGATAADDKVWGQKAGQMVEMPPYFLLPDTVKMIKTLW
jgi:hypothetical protein